MITIVDQVYIFLYAVIGGAIVAFLYDVLRIKRRTIKTSIIIVNLEDILYWLISAVLMFVMVYNSNNGEIRGYIFIGNIIGVALYLSLLSNLIIASSMMVINFIKRILLFFWKIFSYPFILIFKVLSVPCLFIFRLLFKATKYSSLKAKGVSKKAYSFTKVRIKKLSVWGKYLLKHRKKT